MDPISESELFRLTAMSSCERRLKSEGFLRVAGVDEAGRGPLAGPVVAAACILPESVHFAHLNDSKQLLPERRDLLFAAIVSRPDLYYGIGIVEVDIIDRINILQATFLAMKKAVEALRVPPDYLLVDGNQIPHFEIPTESMVQGDCRSISIAAASILAKVTRDRIMESWDAQYPNYGFKQHKGYATEQHLEAIRKWGPSSIHRRSFEPVKSMLNPQPVQIELFDEVR